MDTLTDRQTFSSAEACALADITYRQLDYWCRIGVTSAHVVAKGSGSRRRFTARQVYVLAVLGQVGGFVPISQLDELAALLLDWEPDRWEARLLVGKGGVWLTDEAGAPPVCTSIDLAAIRAEVDARAIRAA